MKQILTTMVCLLITISIKGQTSSFSSVNNFKEGDLLFCISPNANNITAVTKGIKGQQIDHVAIVHKYNNNTCALEAIHKGVCLTPIDSFMARRNQVLHTRLRDTTGVYKSVKRALQYIGRPYDFFFMPSDSAFYCSELVQKCYFTSHGKQIFKPIPMSFHDKTGKITPFWTEYYAKQGLKVPEGEPGSNPGQLSRSKKIRIIGIVNK